MNLNRPETANWLSQANDVTRLFVSANRIPGMINLAGGLPDPQLYPNVELARISERVVLNYPNDVFDYGPVEGLPALRDFVAQKFSSAELTLKRENVLIVTGSLQGLDIIGKALLDQGSIAAVQSPAYLGALDAWRPREPEYRHMYPHSNGFDAVASLSGAKFGYAVPNFSNPTGQLVNLNKRQMMVDAAHETGVWLIEDNPYGSLYYDSAPLPLMLTLSGAKKPGIYDGPVIYMGTISKELAPGLRVGWIIAAPEMIEMLATIKQGADICTSGLCQRVTLEALRTGLTDDLLPMIHALYKPRRDALCNAMSEHLSPWFEFQKPEGGMFAWATARNLKLDSDELLRLSLKEKVCFAPGSVFDTDGVYRNSIRLNFTFNPPQVLAEGVKRVANVLKGATAI